MIKYDNNDYIMIIFSFFNFSKYYSILVIQYSNCWKKEISSPVFKTESLYSLSGFIDALISRCIHSRFYFPSLCTLTVFKFVFAQQMATTLFNRYVLGSRHSQLEWNLFCAISFCVWRFIYNLRIILFAFVLCNNHVLSLSYQCLDNV